MKKKILILLAFTVFLFGCERTEKPEGWDEKNKKPEVEKDITEELKSKFDLVLDELKSKSSENLKEVLGDNPVYEDLYNYIHDEVENIAISKDKVDEFLKDKKDEIKDFFDEYILKDDKNEALVEFKDKLQADIESGKIKFDDKMSFDDFKQLIISNLDMYKPDMSSSDKSRFVEENQEFFNEFYMDMLVWANHTGNKASDKLIEEAVDKVRSMNEDEINIIFGDYPTYESFKIYIHSYISGAKQTMNTLEIEKVLDENEEYILEEFEEIFKN